LDGAAAHLGTLIGTTLFALVFLQVRRLEGLAIARDGRLVSFSAGVAIAYVFVDIMPHLASKQRVLLAARDSGLYGFLEHHAYLISLVGFVLYLASFVGTMGSDGRLEVRSDHPRARWIRGYISAGACAYVGLIAYMLSEQPSHRREPVVLFSLAMAIHMYGVAHFERLRLGADGYDRLHRYLIAGSAYLGWITGVLSQVPETSYALWFSLMAGGIFGITVTVELATVTTPRHLRIFVLGATLLTSLILLLERFSQLD